ncbi:hypothetical protein EDD86DRAFT_211543 [Gorgonomyces haynaldii]|nr:hypothetical protein EDD86DRAFT_211543 [Gorgonomyces haynaldii]
MGYDLTFRPILVSLQSGPNGAEILALMAAIFSILVSLVLLYFLFGKHIRNERIRSLLQLVLCINLIWDTIHIYFSYFETDRLIFWIYGLWGNIGPLLAVYLSTLILESFVNLGGPLLSVHLPTLRYGLVIWHFVSTFAGYASIYFLITGQRQTETFRWMMAVGYWIYVGFIGVFFNLENMYITYVFLRYHDGKDILEGRLLIAIIWIWAVLDFIGFVMWSIMWWYFTVEQEVSHTLYGSANLGIVLMTYHAWILVVMFKLLQEYHSKIDRKKATTLKTVDVPNKSTIY